MDTQGSEVAGGGQVNRDQVILMRLISAGRRGTRAGSAKQVRGRHFQKETNQNLNTTLKQPKTEEHGIIKTNVKGANI